MASNKKPRGFTIVLVPERSALDNGLGNTRRLLLSAAEEVFGEHGFHRGSISHICRRVGLLENICAEKGDRVKIIRPGETATGEEIEGKVARYKFPKSGAVTQEDLNSATRMRRFCEQS